MCLQKHHVGNLVVCVSHDITYMDSDIVMLLLQHLHFTDRVETEEEQSIKVPLLTHIAW